MSSGSLNLKGTVGTWAAQTNNCALAVNQSLLSISGFIRIDAFSTASAVNVFGQTSFPSSNAFGINAGGAFSSTVFYVKGTVSASYAWPIGLGQSIHFAMTLSPTVAKVYINGIVKASTNNPGVTLASTNSIHIGTSAASANNVLLSDLAIWNGYELSGADINNLRDRVTDPTTTPVSATSWWRLNGTPPNNPVVGDGAMNDAIGLNHFSTIPGSGGSATAAVYSSTTLNFVPSISCVAAHVTRSGSIFMMHIGTNPALGTTSPVYPTTIPANPSFSINGTPVTVQGPFWSSQATGNASHRLPWISYQPHSGSSPIIVQPSDVVTWTAPGNWIQATEGIAGAESGTLSNFSGGYETGVFTYMGFDPPASDKTFRPGFNGANGKIVVTAFKNQLHSSSNPFSGANTSTADGIPITFNATGVISANVTQSSSNQMDSKQFPAAPGDWTYIADETNPGAPIVMSLTGNQNTLITGPVVTGTTTNKKWVWTVVNGASTYNNSLNLKWTAPSPHSLGQAFTHQNLKMFMGGDTPVNTISPTDDSSDVYRDLQTAAPGIACAFLRYLAMSWDKVSRARASDLPSATALSLDALPPVAATVWPVSEPGRTGDRAIPIYAVRPYDFSTAPKVYCHINYQHAVTSDNLSVAPYMIRPGDWGLDYDWLDDTGSTGLQVVFEVLCGDAAGNPIPHNLVSGQFLNGFSFNFPCFNSNGSGTCTPSSPSLAWVTGPSTFVTKSGSNLIKAFDVGKCTALTVLPGNETCTVSSVNVPTIEQMGAATKADGNPGIWICVNHAMDNACVTSWATRLRSATAVGTPIYIQISNEAFIDSFVGTAWHQAACLSGFGYMNQGPCIVRRADEVQTLFETVWGADSGSIVRVFQPWTVQPNNTTVSLNYAQANSIRIDRIAIAPYIDMDDSPEFVMAAAAIVADMPDSIAHTSKGGPGVIMPMAAYHDLVRHFLKYNKSWNGPGSFIQQHIDARDGTGYGTGIGSSHFVYPKPKMIVYEGVLSDAIPPGVSTTTKAVRGGLSHDFNYHPAHYDTIQAVCQHLQQPGPAGSEGFAAAAINNLCSGRTFGGIGHFYNCPDGHDNLVAAQWCQVAFLGQQIGRGLSNKYWANTPAFGGDLLAHDFENEAVAMKSFHDWLISEATGDPASATMAKTEGHDAAVIPARYLKGTIAGTGRNDTAVAAGRCITGAMAVTGANDAATLAGRCISGAMAGLGRNDTAVMLAGANLARVRVSPSRIKPRQSVAVTLQLVGTGTSWTSGSTVNVTNSITGTTTVVKGTWTRTSATTATLTVTTGGGAGIWKLTIDGVASPFLVVGSEHKWWSPRIRLRGRQS